MSGTFIEEYIHGTETLLNSMNFRKQARILMSINNVMFSPAKPFYYP